MTDPGILLTDADGMRNLLLGRIESKEWWLIVDPGHAHDLLETIEARHYAGDRNGDYHLLFGPPPWGGRGILAVALAKKRHMSPAQFARLLVGAGCFPRRHRSELTARLDTQDILVATPDVATGAALQCRMFDWLMGRPSLGSLS